MKLTIEQIGQFYYGYLNNIEVTHRLNGQEAERLNEEEYGEIHAGSEATVFLTRKSLVKAARQQCRRLGTNMEE